MKRFLSLILLFCLLLSGCTVLGETIKEPVTFYYVSDNYKHDMEQVIVPEIREASGHREDLPYLLALYSMGPATENLTSLLPANANIILTERTENAITLSLSGNSQNMTDANFSLTSACIALTCMELTDVQQVTVVCGERDVTIREDNLLLYSHMQKLQEDVN